MYNLINQKFVILLKVILLVSCNGNKNNRMLANSDSVEIILDSLNSSNLNLIAYPYDFLNTPELEEWKGFEKLHESMERLKELNFDGIEVDLIALSARLKKLRSSPLPMKLEIPQIKSRLKVVEMQVQKARYFTKHYKADSLIPSLNLLYEYYNGFVLRMIALQNENQKFITESDSVIKD